jgi:hypothetical protein
MRTNGLAASVHSKLLLQLPCLMFRATAVPLMHHTRPTKDLQELCPYDTSAVLQTAPAAQQPRTRSCTCPTMRSGCII